MVSVISIVWNVIRDPFTLMFAWGTGLQTKRYTERFGWEEEHFDGIRGKSAVVIDDILELTKETDQKAYCFRYETAKSFVDAIEGKLEHNEYRSKGSAEQARNLVSNFRNLEAEGLRYECKNI